MLYEWSSFCMSYKPFLVHHVTQPFEVHGFEGGEDEKRALLVALGFLDGSFRVGDAHGGLRAHVLLEPGDWSLVQSEP